MYNPIASFKLTISKENISDYIIDQVNELKNNITRNLSPLMYSFDESDKEYIFFFRRILTIRHENIYDKNAEKDIAITRIYISSLNNNIFKFAEGKFVIEVPTIKIINLNN